MSQFPQIFRVHQKFVRPRVEDVEGQVHDQLGRLALADRVQPGQSVAITAGSRGITNIHLILKCAVESLTKIGAKPFLVPSMGSHGGGTAEGQRKVLESYGITEQFCGCPIRSSMETIVVCRAREGFDVHFDQLASQADHVLVVGRVRPHTRFNGRIESGLMKMLLIGLGKHNGATVYHRAIIQYNFDQIVRSVAAEVLDRCRILGGLAIVENAYKETGRIEAVWPEQFIEREMELLNLAKQWMPRIPFPETDLLIIDEIGKDISGSGMDTNIIGRKANLTAQQQSCHVKKIIVRGLSAQTNGNASGIGVADLVTRRAVDQMDLESTWINCLTAAEPGGGKIPIYFDTDRQLIEIALGQIGLTEPEQARVQWIPNTLHLLEVECSVAYLDEARQRDDLEILTDPRPLPLDEAGQLLSFS